MVRPCRSRIPSRAAAPSWSARGWTGGRRLRLRGAERRLAPDEQVDVAALSPTASLKAVTFAAVQTDVLLKPFEDERVGFVAEHSAGVSDPAAGGNGEGPEVAPDVDDRIAFMELRCRSGSNPSCTAHSSSV